MWSGLRYIAEERVLVCEDCRVAVPKQQIRSHLDYSHRLVPARRRRDLEAQFLQLDARESWVDLTPRPDGSPPFPYIQEPVPGFYCTSCDVFKTTSAAYLRQHRAKVHPHESRRSTPEVNKCFLQSWAQNRRQRVYWSVDAAHVVTDTLKTSVASPVPRWSENDFGDIDEAERREQGRLSHEHECAPALDGEIDQDENSDWLRGCEWPRWFAHRPLSLIVAMSQIPETDPRTDIVLGSWHGMDCVATALEEQTLRRLLTATSLVFERCEDTLKSTPRVLRCWLRSWSSLYLPYPFEMVKQDRTRRRYYRYFQRFLCYIFRVWTIARRLKERTIDLTGLQLTEEQCRQMDSVWSGFTNLPGSLNSQADHVQSATNLAALIENLYQLMAMFWTDTSLHTDTYQSAVVHYSGVLGIHPYELAFRDAYDYTPYLSALIWVGRLLLLEYALPRQQYAHLTFQWPDRNRYPDQLARLNQIRIKYLFRGSIAPCGYLIERLRHGRAIARHHGPRTNISWSPDGQTLSMDGGKVTMSQLRFTIHAAIVHVRQMTHDLLLGGDPMVDLTRYQDDLVNRRPGFSFLAHPPNDLSDTFRVLSARAFRCTNAFNFQKRAGQQKIHQYLRDCDKLIRALYGAIHLTSGMPARSTELRLLRWANTATVRRNIYIHQGQVILIFSYNKATTNHNNAFYVVRSPCPAVQESLFLYLAYIRPFRDFLCRHIGLVAKDEPTSSFLFSSVKTPTSCFSASVCSSSLHESTSKSPVKLGIASYRQLAVSVAKRHLVSLTKNFDPHIPHDENGILRTMSWQAGHHAETHSSHYALEREFPAKLQPQLINRYLENSRIWHEFNLISCHDVISIDIDHTISTIAKQPSPLGYLPDSPPPTSPIASSEISIGEHSPDSGVVPGVQGWILRSGFLSSVSDTVSTGRHTQSLKRRTPAETETSPTSKRIRVIQQELEELFKNRQQR